MPLGVSGEDRTTPVNDSVAASSRSRRVPRVYVMVIGAALAVLLLGVVVVISLKLTHGQTTPAQHTGQPPAPPTSFAIPGCYNPATQPVERPNKLNVLGCASVAVALQGMSWSSWGPQGADGAGTAVFKICDPNCAAGYQLTKPVVVHAWNPQQPRPDAICQAGLKIFGDMILAFPDGAPPPTAQKTNTQYNGMPAVHFTNYAGADNSDSQF